ncbi:MAG TPA: cardiolipin synthase ClsB [Burkholderiales bacterium]|nr:cardiolipin synthase ClsB [Burkholderiales bacterium]
MAARFTNGNRLHLLHAGAEYFPALDAAIRSARQSVFLESYIYARDATGRRVTRALCDAASRGVAVHVLVDGFGARDMPEEFAKDLASAGARLLVFRPDIFPLPWRRERLRRMHRKLAVVDGRVAFVGGINIIDDADTPHQRPPRYDFAAKIEGPLVGEVAHEVERLWNRIAIAGLRPEWRVRISGDPPPAPKGHQRAALVVRDNLRHRRSIEDAYLEAMDAASEEIIIANAYFFPGTRFRRALVRAAARRVRVRLLLQARVEYVALHYATRALYGALLEAGVEIYEYRRSFMHAKVAVVDGRWATVGSSNIDPFSLLLAREANLVVEDERFARELRGRLLEDIARGARIVKARHWSRQPLWKRIPYWIAYGLTRFTIGVLGLGGRF